MSGVLFYHDWIYYCYALASFVAQDAVGMREYLSIAISKAKANQPSETILQIDNLFNLGLYALLDERAELAREYYEQALEKQPDRVILKEAIWNLKVLQITALSDESVDMMIQFLKSYL